MFDIWGYMDKGFNLHFFSHGGVEVYYNGHTVFSRFQKNWTIEELEATLDLYLETNMNEENNNDYR